MVVDVVVVVDVHVVVVIGAVVVVSILGVGLNSVDLTDDFVVTF